MEKDASHVMAMGMTVSVIGFVLMVMGMVVISVVMMLVVVTWMIMVTMVTFIGMPVVVRVTTRGPIAVVIGWGMAHIVLPLCTPEGSNQAPTRARRPLAEHAGGTGRGTMRDLRVNARRF
jgi:hypothetical protein